MFDFFKKNSGKTEQDWVKNPNAVAFTSNEIVEVEHKGTGKKHSFHIGCTDDGSWYALTDHEQRPRFCFEAVDRDEAYSKGVDALNFYMEHIDKNGD